MAAWLHSGNKSHKEFLWLTKLGRGNPLSWEIHSNVSFTNWQAVEHSNNYLMWEYTQRKLGKIGNQAVKYTGSYFTVVKVSSNIYWGLQNYIFTSVQWWNKKLQSVV